MAALYTSLEYDLVQAARGIVQFLDYFIICDVILLLGSEDTVAVRCPIPFLGIFKYSFDTGTGDLCSNGSNVNVCANKKTMTWDYSKCNQIQAYSGRADNTIIK